MLKKIPTIFENLICDALRDLETSVKFKKREKHPWGSVTINMYKWHQLAQSVPYNNILAILS